MLQYLKTIFGHTSRANGSRIAFIRARPTDMLSNYTNNTIQYNILLYIISINRRDTSCSSSMR